jgi:hypothetical protein
MATKRVHCSDYARDKAKRDKEETASLRLDRKIRANVSFLKSGVYEDLFPYEMNW